MKDRLVYVGVSAGSIAVASLFAETYSAERSCAGNPLSTEETVFSSAEGEVSVTLITANGMGLTNFALIPHFENREHFASSHNNAEKWASKITVPVYAIDDDTAIMVKDSNIEVISEGRWKMFTPDTATNR